MGGVLLLKSLDILEKGRLILQFALGLSSKRRRDQEEMNDRNHLKTIPGFYACLVAPNPLRPLRNGEIQGSIPPSASVEKVGWPYDWTFVAAPRIKNGTGGTLVNSGHSVDRYESGVFACRQP